jgi:hypothetical protein
MRSARGISFERGGAFGFSNQGSIRTTWPEEDAIEKAEWPYQVTVSDVFMGASVVFPEDREKRREEQPTRRIAARWADKVSPFFVYY